MPNSLILKDLIINTGENFIILRDGLESFLSYRITNSVLDLHNAYVPESLRGTGLASDLILHSMHYAVMNGYRIKPSHPAVIRFLEINREWQYLTVYSLN